MKIGFLVTTLNTIKEDLTTHDIAFAGLLRGHEIYFFTVFDFFSNENSIFGNVVNIPSEISTRVELAKKIKLLEKTKLDLKTLDCVFIRHKLEPSDRNYSYHKSAREYCFHLSLLGVKILNNPVYLPFFSSKLSYLSLPKEILPKKQLVTTNLNEALKFCKELKYEAVIKPISGKGGEDIYFTERKNLQNNLKSILKKSPVLIQSYIKNDGDKRILLLDGEPIGHYLRVAGEGEFLNNIHSGGKAKESKLTNSDKKIIDLIKPILKIYGMVFVGIDILGNTLSEINTENPGGTVRSEKFGKFNSREKIIDWIENHLK